MEYEWRLEDLPRVWPNVAMVIGATTLVAFVPLLWSGEKPWDLGEAGLVDARVTWARHLIQPARHAVEYTFDVGERSFTGQYKCEHECPIESAKLGGTVRVEYLLADPARNRPVGAMTRSILRYWRIVVVIAGGLLVAGVIGRVLGVGDGE